VKILKDYGASEFFSEYKPRLLLKKSQKNLEIIDLLLYNLVNLTKSEQNPEKSLYFSEIPEKKEVENCEIPEKPLFQKPVKNFLFSTIFFEKSKEKREFLFIYQIPLSPTDEKLLFDLTVKLKFAEKTLVNFFINFLRNSP